MSALAAWVFARKATAWGPVSLDPELRPPQDDRRAKEWLCHAATYWSTTGLLETCLDGGLLAVPMKVLPRHERSFEHGTYYEQTVLAFRRRPGDARIVLVPDVGFRSSSMGNCNGAGCRWDDVTVVPNPTLLHVRTRVREGQGRWRREAPSSPPDRVIDRIYSVGDKPRELLVLEQTVSDDGSFVQIEPNTSGVEIAGCHHISYPEIGQTP
ncbi:MAG TPA: hypothetical protein VM925_24430 [Labilithrix sp.]|nr:hypothetical protein [Labilithrix sp.]